MKIAPITAYEPKLQAAYGAIKARGLLPAARSAVENSQDSDAAFLAIHDLLPAADRHVLSWFGEDDCWLLVSLCLDYELVDAGR